MLLLNLQVCVTFEPSGVIFEPSSVSVTPELSSVSVTPKPSSVSQWLDIHNDTRRKAAVHHHDCEA